MWEKTEDQKKKQEEDMKTQEQYGGSGTKFMRDRESGGDSEAETGRRLGEQEQ